MWDLAAARPVLVLVLRGHAGQLPILTAEADLLDFPQYIVGPTDVILCMGDTLTHLASKQAIESLFAQVAGALAPGGAFVAKAFQGGETAGVIAALKQRFEQVRIIKPKASRAESSEVYLAATGFRGP